MAEPDYRGYAAAGTAALQHWYRPWRGLWATTGWWNSANALTAVIGYTQWTGDRSYAGVIETTFRAGAGTGARSLSPTATTTTTPGGHWPGWRLTT